MLTACSVLFLVFACVAFAGVPFRRDAAPEPLRFTSNGTFQITIFEDLHFGESKQISMIRSGLPC